MRALTDDELEGMRQKLSGAFDRAVKGYEQHSRYADRNDDFGQRGLLSIQALATASQALLDVNGQIEKRLSDRDNPLDKPSVRSNHPGN